MYVQLIPEFDEKGGVKEWGSCAQSTTQPSHKFNHERITNHSQWIWMFELAMQHRQQDDAHFIAKTIEIAVFVCFVVFTLSKRQSKSTCTHSPLSVSIRIFSPCRSPSPTTCPTLDHTPDDLRVLKVNEAISLRWPSSYGCF